MTKLKQLSRLVGKNFGQKSINWFPGHMYSGMKTILGKLNTVDCVVEVHDARIPFIGRNSEFRKQLGVIKPRILVLNKSDLADLSQWDRIKHRLSVEGDNDVVLTDMTGSQFSYSERGYTQLLDNVVRSINNSDRYNRVNSNFFQIMIVGIPNVGKSTLINRLRQLHLGKRGEPAKIGPEAGVTKHVDFKIKICSRPPIYSLDTPGILEPGVTKDNDQAMQLALCSSINDKALNPNRVVDYLIKFLHRQENYSYQFCYNLNRPVYTAEDFIDIMKSSTTKLRNGSEARSHNTEPETILWDMIKRFRRGEFGKVMFD